MDTQTHTHTRPIFIILLRVLVDAGTCLPSRCVATESGIKFTEPLPNNMRRHTYTDTNLWEGFIKYTLKWTQVARYCIPGFMNISSDIQNLIRGINRHTDTDCMEIA